MAERGTAARTVEACPVWSQVRGPLQGQSPLAQSRILPGVALAALLSWERWAIMLVLQKEPDPYSDDRHMDLQGFRTGANRADLKLPSFQT